MFILHNAALNNEKPSNRDMKQCVGGTVGKRERQRCARDLFLLIKTVHVFIYLEISGQKSVNGKLTYFPYLKLIVNK